jgi:hypothetical protein
MIDEQPPLLRIGTTGILLIFFSLTSVGLVGCFGILSVTAKPSEGDKKPLSKDNEAVTQ